jgi:hypothetical protein
LATPFDPRPFTEQYSDAPTRFFVRIENFPTPAYHRAKSKAMHGPSSKIIFLTFALLSMTCFRLTSAQTNTLPRNASNYTLAIYPARNPSETLTRYTLDSNLVASPRIIPKPTEMQLAQSPVLSDRDFTSYNLTNHSITITAQAARGLAARLMPESTDPKTDVLLSWRDTSFVLFAGGTPIYVGMFSCSTSSQKYPMPTIYPDRLLPFVPAHSHRDVSLTIRGGVLTSTNTDPRADPRILATLKKLRLQ